MHGYWIKGQTEMKDRRVKRGHFVTIRVSFDFGFIDRRSLSQPNKKKNLLIFFVRGKK